MEVLNASRLMMPLNPVARQGASLPGRPTVFPSLIRPGRPKRKRGFVMKRKEIVTLDGEHVYEAWIGEDTWNGFQCPYFEKHVAEKMAEDMLELSYDQKTDSFVWEEVTDRNESGNYEEFSACDIETPEGFKKVYAIGAWAWVWDLAKESRSAGQAVVLELSKKWAAFSRLCGDDLVRPDGFMDLVKQQHPSIRNLMLKGEDDGL